MANILEFKKRVLIRVDFNVPIENGIVVNLNRVKAVIPTIKYFLNLNMSVILMSHLGRPKKVDQRYSLKILINPLSKFLNQKVLFCSSITDSTMADSMSPGEVLLLENLRFYSGEIENSVNFAKCLSKYGDIYINDAFGSSHREHASISRIHEFFQNKKFMGFLLERELNELEKLKKASAKSYTVIIGGAKIGSKIHVLETFLNIADTIIIGGGMAFPFIKYLGGSIGKSLCVNTELDIVKSFLLASKKSNTKIILPVDCVITNNIEEKSNIKYSDIMLVPDDYTGVDIGPKTIKLFQEIISQSKLIMWNGPMGVAEIHEFSQGTKKLSQMIIESTERGAYSIIGGGDTVSDVSRFGLQTKFSYVSTGGGAMLEFFRNENLPGLLGLQKLTI